MISLQGRQDGTAVISPRLTCRAHVRSFKLETCDKRTGQEGWNKGKLPLVLCAARTCIALKPTPSNVSGGQYFLGRFSAEIGTQQGFHAWSDIQEFKAIPTDDYRYFKAKQVNTCPVRCGENGEDTGLVVRGVCFFGAPCVSIVVVVVVGVGVEVGVAVKTTVYT